MHIMSFFCRSTALETLCWKLTVIPFRINPNPADRLENSNGRSVAELLVRTNNVSGTYAKEQN